jgi:FkbM family methyltransferase
MSTSRLAALLHGRGFRRRFPRLVSWIDRVLPAITHPTKRCTIRGLEFHLDARNERIAQVPYASGAYEPEEAAAIEALVRPGSVFVDIGANLGYFTCLAARAAGPTGRVFAFEPDRLNVRLLRRNVRANGFGNVTVIPAAVGARDGEIALYRSEINHTDHRVYDHGDGRPSSRVRLVALDSYFPRGSRIDILKVDIQGFEGQAFAGMRRILTEQRDRLVILTEFFPDGLERAGSGPSELLAFFATAGLRTWFIDGTPADLASALARSAADGYTNLLVAEEFPAALAGLAERTLTR